MQRKSCSRELRVFGMAKRTAIIIVLLIMTCFSAPVNAEEGNERDPFFPSEKKPAVPLPSPGEVDWGRDPFNNPLGRGPAPKGTTGRVARSGLTGIIYSKHDRVAIIGGEALREGSMVGDKRLADIRKKSVVLRDAAGGHEEIFLEDFSMGR
jgi:hypothetical protein